MDGIKQQPKTLGDPETVYYSTGEKIVKRNDFKAVRESEELMSILASRTGYQRSEMMGMWLHEMYALIVGLVKNSEK